MHAYCHYAIVQLASKYPCTYCIPTCTIDGMDGYLPRVADSELKERLRIAGAVVIEGPKACGKTSTASRVARTVFRLDADDSVRLGAMLAPDRMFANPTPILFDEWQLEPSLWNRIRHEVDSRGERGLYVLTGSSTPNDDARRHSGAGRFGVMQMRPMSLFESGHSTGDMSLTALVGGHEVTGDGRALDFETLVRCIVAGGWPAMIADRERDARSWLADYLAQIVEVDVPALGSRRNPRGLRRLFASLARSMGQATKASELARDVGGADGPAAPETIRLYLDALERLHLIEDSPAWAPHMRSRTRLRSAAVRYLVDPSLGAAALRVGSDALIADPRALGFFFEGLVMRDLRIYAQPAGAQVFSWRDANGNEVDAIIDWGDGRWAAAEVKLNPAAVDEGARSLRRFVASVDRGFHGEPAFTAVVTGGGFGGRRPDGVFVVPIGALGP